MQAVMEGDTQVDQVSGLDRPDDSVKVLGCRENRESKMIREPYPSRLRTFSLGIRLFFLLHMPATHPSAISVEH